MPNCQGRLLTMAEQEGHESSAPQGPASEIKSPSKRSCKRKGKKNKAHGGETPPSGMAALLVLRKKWEASCSEKDAEGLNHFACDSA